MFQRDNTIFIIRMLIIQQKIQYTLFYSHNTLLKLFVVSNLVNKNIIMTNYTLVNTNLTFYKSINILLYYRSIHTFILRKCSNNRCIS